MTKLLIKLFIKNSEDVKNPDIRRKYGFLSGFVGIAANILLFSGKLFAGILSGAISIIADAFNNLSDACSSVITLIGFKIAGAPADDEHPFGHGRVEYIAGLIVSMLIILMGFELGKTSVEKIITPEETVFSWVSLGILIASILVKLWMGLFNTKLGKTINSPTMKATAMDSISDVCSTSAVILGIVVSALTGFSIDGFMGLLVAAFIIFTGIKTARESLSPILGEKPSKELTDDIAKTVLSYKGVVGIHDLIVHSYGAGTTMITLHAEVPAEMDFIKAHELIDVIEDDLRIKYSCNASIHMDPIYMNDAHATEMCEKIKTVITEIDPSITMHDFRMTKGEQHENLIFDIVVPFRFKMNDKEVVDEIQRRIYEWDDKCCAVVMVDKQMY